MLRWLRPLPIGLVVIAAILSNQVARPVAQDNLGQVSGMVLDGNRRPVADARVTLQAVHSTYSDSISVPTAPNTPNRAVLTDSKGTFFFASVQPGRYFLAARKVGSVGGSFGQEKPSDEFQWFNLSPGGKPSDIVLRLWQGATIAGVVRAASGSPLANRWVELLWVRRENGVPRLYGLQPPVQTDDRGSYSFYGLQSGNYLVRTSVKAFSAAMIVGGDFRSEPSASFYPGSPIADTSSVIAIDAPAERTDIDITVPDAVPGFQLSGQILGLPASAIERTVKLVLDDPGTVLPPYFELTSVPIQQDGSFAFRGVPPGRYRIRAFVIQASSDQRLRQGSFRPGTEGFGNPGFDERAVWVNQDVVVGDQSLTGLTLQATSGLRVTGKLAITGETVTDPSRLIIMARSLDGWNLDGVPVGWADRDGNFASPALPAGRYIINASSRELLVESVVVRGHDVTDVGVELANADVSDTAMTLTTLRGEITGRVTDNTGKPRPDANILCVRQDSNWLTASTSAGFGIGAYRVRTTPAGDYSLALGAGSYAVIAVVGDIPVDFGDKDFLRSILPKAASISLPRGRKVIQNLEVQVYHK